MKKRTLTGIIVLMSVSLAGIIIVQLLWMKKAIEVKEQQFDRSVNEALTAAVKDIRKRSDIALAVGTEMDSVTWNTASVNGNIAVNSGSNAFVYVTNSDDDDNEEETYAVSSSGKPGSVVVNKLHNKKYRVQTIRKLDSLRTGLNDRQFVVISEFADSVNVIVDKKISQITNQSKSMDKALTELSYEIKSFNMAPEDYADAETIGHSLKESLNDREIDLGFEFAVYNPDSDSLSSIRSVGFNPAEKGQYKTRLYPESYFDRPEMLLINFPNRKGHLLHSLGLLFSGSLLFTLIILITFFVTLKVILRQKKISEIKSDFINNMTHEFKTPIATISLAADSINSPKVISDPKKIRYFTGIIGEENKRMNARVEHVLQMSLLEKEDLSLTREKTDMHELIAGVINNFRLQLEKKNGVIYFKPEAAEHIIYADKLHLTNVVSNLIDNAIKYSDRPEIEMGTNNRNQRFILNIKDNGKGMTYEEQKKIFDKFYRVSTGNIHNVKGFGLGLSYVKAIVETSGGEIKVESIPGKGSEFKVIFPVQS